MADRSLSNQEIRRRLISNASISHDKDKKKKQIEEVIKSTKRIDNEILDIKDKLEKEKADLKKLIGNGGCFQCGGDLEQYLKLKPESSYDEDVLKALRLVISD